MTSAPSPASKSPAYSARSSAISMTLSPSSMPGPLLPIISPGPAAFPACFAKTFSRQMFATAVIARSGATTQSRSEYTQPDRDCFAALAMTALGKDNPANERLEQGDAADPGAERVDEAVLGGGQARRSGIAALPELRPIPASALCDLHPMRLDRPQIRAR